MHRLHNKVVVVTAAASPVARQVALLMAAEGAYLIVTDPDNAAAEDTAEMIRAQGATVFTTSWDHVTSDHAASVIEAAMHHYEKIDGLFHLLPAVDRADHLAAAGAVTQAAARALTPRRRGSIILAWPDPTRRHAAESHDDRHSDHAPVSLIRQFAPAVHPHRIRVNGLSLDPDTPPTAAAYAATFLSADESAHLTAQTLRLGPLDS